MNKKDELLIDILKDMRMLISYVRQELPSLKGNPNVNVLSNDLCEEIDELEDELYNEYRDNLED